MRWKQISELIKVNILYANPQLLEKKRQKTNQEADTIKSAVWTVVLQNVMILFLFLALYTFMLRGLDFSQYPGYFSLYLTLFVVMTIFQGFYVIYNLLYESKDLIHYLPLPFKTSEVFLAKFAVITLNILPYIAPVLALFLLLGQDIQLSAPVNILASLGLFLLLVTVVFLFAVILVHFLSQLSFFKKNKKVMTTVLYSIASVGMIGMILLISNTAETNIEFSPGIFLPDNQLVPVFSFLHTMMTSPFSPEGLIGFAVWFVLLAIFVFIVIKIVMPGFYQQSDVSKISNKKIIGAKKGSSKAPSIQGTLLKYNFSLIQDGTLMMQYISSNIVFPIIWLGPMLTGNSFFNNLESTKFWGLAFLIGVLYSYLTMGPMSTVAVIISLERENFSYVKSLPFSMKQYLGHKFWFAYMVQLLLPFVVGSVLIVLSQVPLLLALIFLAGLAIGIFGQSEHYFARDYRLLRLDWQSLTELFNRGGGNFVQAIRVFVVLIVGVIVVIGASFLLSVLSPVGQQLFSGLLLLLPMLVIFLRHLKHKKDFWSQL